MNEQEPQDLIGLASMVFFGHHGATEEEQAVGQRFVVDLEMALDLAVAGHSDDLVDTVDYGRAFRDHTGRVGGAAARAVGKFGRGCALRRLLDEFPIERVRIRVSKPSAPILGRVGRGVG